MNHTISTKVYSLFLSLAVVQCWGQVPNVQQAVAQQTAQGVIQSEPSVASPIAGQSVAQEVSVVLPTGDQQKPETTEAQPQTIQAEQPGVQELALGPDMLNGLFGGGSAEDFNKLISDLLNNMHEEELKKEAEKRARLINILPEHVKTSVEASSKVFNDLGSAIKMESCFTSLCQDIRQSTITLVPDDIAWKKDVIAVLEKLNQALADGTFIDKIAPFNGGMTDLSGGMMAMVMRMTRNMKPQAGAAWTEQDTVVLCEKLNLLTEYVQGHTDQTFDLLRTSVTNVSKLLSLAQRKEIKELCAQCVMLIQPVFEKTAQQLRETLHLLADEYIKLPKDADPQLKEALTYWLTAFKTHHHTIRSFITLTAESQHDFSFVLRYMAQVYDVVSAFFIANRFDAALVPGTAKLSSVLSQPSNLVDAMLRMSMVGMLYFQRRGEMASGELHKYLTGVGSLKDFVNPLDQWEYKLMLAAFTVPVIIDPTKYGERMHPVNRAFWRILGAFFWYHWQNSDTTKNKWPDKDRTMRIALAVTIHEAQQFLSSYFQGKIYQHSDLVLLEKIETYTVGLVKPALVDLALEIIVPLAFMNKWFNKVADLHNEDFAPFSPLLKKLFISDSNELRAHIEQLVLHYVCSNVGEFAGKSVAGAFHDSLISGFMSLIQGIGSTIESFLLEDEDIEKEVPGGVPQQNTEAGLFSSQSLDMFKKLLVSLFAEQSPERMMVIGFLKNNGYLEESVTDHREINFKIIAMVFFYCTNVRLLTHAQSADLLCQYRDTYQNNVGPFIDIVFAHIKKNAAAAVGGAVGSFAGHIAATIIYNRYRPPVLLPKPNPQGPAATGGTPAKQQQPAPSGK